jgi:hypothetical protein
LFNDLRNDTFMRHKKTFCDFAEACRLLSESRRVLFATGLSLLVIIVVALFICMLTLAVGLAYMHRSVVTPMSQVCIRHS